ncbi:hypothetical protein MKW98_007881 [Papaver atlanticum]|uniref:Rad60/SUMO-like domain-containing protein n=1 Tax=Papaver atlanticum TaxID=357466 RepID=A0AAD4XGL7_9MAGN|nr:hypothetical protein MKW98_007881 [Papaver atlanticum]
MAAVTNVVKVEEEKPVEEEPDSRINIKVASNDGHGTVVCFRIKPKARMGRLMEAYCDALKIDFTSVKFILDDTDKARTYRRSSNFSLICSVLNLMPRF